MISFKGSHFPKAIILWAVRWYAAYPLAYRMLEEMLFERGIKIDHSTIQRWVVKYSQSLLAAFRKHKQAIGKRWKLDETYVKVKGQWVYLYRAVDKAGHTVDFLLTPNRDEEAARTFFDQAVAHNGQPELVNIDKSGANKAAIAHYNSDKIFHLIFVSLGYFNGTEPVFLSGTYR